MQSGSKLSLKARGSRTPVHNGEFGVLRLFGRKTVRRKEKAEEKKWSKGWVCMKCSLRT